MSCVVAITDGKHVWMGADSAVTDTSGEITELATKKIVRRGGLMIGYTGDLRAYRVLKFGEGFPRRKKDEDAEHFVARFLEWLERVGNGDKLDNDLIVAVGGRLFLSGGYSMCETQKPYQAIGSGSAYAIAVLEYEYADGEDPKQLILDALEVAARRSVGVRPPFYVEKV